MHFYLSKVCFAAWIASASSFSPAFQSKSTVLRTSTTQLYEDNSFLFGGKVEGMPDKPPPAPPIDEDNPSGGQMFRKMMERAKNGPSRPSAGTGAQGGDFNAPTTQQQNYQYNAPAAPQQPVYGQQQAQPIYSSQPAYPPQPQAGAAPADPYSAYQAQLQAWQQQMNSFAQFSTANPQAAAQMTMPPPPPPPQAQQPMQIQQQQPATVSPPQPQTDSSSTPKDPYEYLPKGDGRNKLAYEVNNVADVYFAQLKRDSTIRTEARRRGDLETANTPMVDEGVKALGNLFSDELMKSRREQVQKNGGEFETSRDEMILPSHFVEDVKVDKTYTGVSYKEKLMQAKQKKGQNVPATTPEPQPKPASESANVSQFVPPVKEFNLGGQSNPAASTINSQLTSTSTASPAGEEESKEQQSNFALSVKDESEIDEISAPSMEDSDATRQSIRTLMGLLLKHRGGPGFGKGRLKDAEGQKLEDSVKAILALLKEESGVVGAVAVAAPSTSNLNPTSPLYGAITCVDAAVTLYKNADAATQGDLVVPLRDALMSAVKTLDEQIEKGSISAADAQQLIDATGATEALSSAKSEPAPAAKPVYATTMEFPDNYQVTQKEEDEIKEIEEAIAASVELSSENTARLQKVYDSLKALTGDKKYGLKDVSVEEAKTAKEALIDMRSVLMDELGN